MKINFIRTFVMFAIITSFLGCSSVPKVSRVDSNTVVDLSGYWNDTDLRIVTSSLINACTDSPRIAAFAKAAGRPPVVIVGSFKNQSDEHIDTSILVKRFESALVNSGKVDFVASSSERDELRGERIDQQSNASEATARRLGNETGADFMLQGSVKTIIDTNGKDMVRTYFVFAELVNLETNQKTWTGDNADVKKIIKRPKTRA
ncbi:MAG: penicillin-binding protein activator LpoB [Treponemataceae bacterium]